MNNYVEKARESAKYIMSKIGEVPYVAIVLGSGLGPLVDEIQNPIELDYSEIPNFPVTTVIGHAGKLVFGTIGGKKVIAMKGRFHYYEGHDLETVTLGVRVFKMMGINNLLVTNAAGGINKSFKAGDLMIIKDHIGYFAPSALRGENLEEFGTRFPDMSEAYSKKLIDIAERSAKEIDIEVKKGIYMFAQGPMYETPAEIRASAIMGADAVGMSTIPEVIAAKHAKMNILGISCITNMASGILDKPLSHEEVFETANLAGKKFTAWVKKIIENW